MKNNLLYKIFIHLFLLIVSLLIIFLCFGVGMGSWSNPLYLDDISLSIRWPRIVSSLVVGASLSCSGAALQSLFGNPLVDSSIIGTSSGAALGAVIVLAFQIVGFGLPFAAFLGALIICLFVLAIHHFLGGGKFGLLIIGFIISTFCSSIVSLILFFSNDATLRSAITWMAGNLSDPFDINFIYPLSAVLLGWLILIFQGKSLDCLMLGDETATSMGVNLTRVRILVIIGVSLLTGASVAMSGVIGLIGMMIPNIISNTLGGNRTKIMLYSTLLGSMFLLVVDSIPRYLSTQSIEFPIGILVSLLGAPFFLWVFIVGIRKK